MEGVRHHSSGRQEIVTASKSDGRGDSDRNVRTALGRVVASPALAKSPQLAHFLTFIVEETLAGRGDRLKAFTIATDALGRDANFDPQTDPIVRVEAGRLRRALEQYYATDGRNDPVAIDLPTGHYVPVFRDNAAPRGVMTRLRSWRRQTSGVLRENIRLILLVAFVAALVSLSFDLMWMVLGLEHGSIEASIRALPAALSEAKPAVGVKP